MFGSCSMGRQLRSGNIGPRSKPSTPWGCGSRRCRRRTWRSSSRRLLQSMRAISTSTWSRSSVERVEPLAALLLTSQDLWGTAATRGPLDSTAIYWCRYENARGQTWETTNPADQSTRLEITRVRRVKATEAREKEVRDRMRDSNWETRVLGRFVD